MEITEVRITLMNGRRDSVKAFASITFDDCFVIRSLKIVENNGKYQVFMPNRKHKNGSFTDMAFPIKNDMRIKIQIKVLEKYEEELKNNLPYQE